ncbi:helix-turn-helix domain-containing protein [Streptomyces sp. NBC_01294]|uniref:helix-turn-helix domain-containing protein n=1 Tax=Streptomyces sp. NBC_01294 TaxID=2903815 RepID=UPI002DDB40D4|nr:helix-turn-helix transcriptional regulator [Streptomyces sp. NBC_01294]WRZ56681.1 helix-turn-helix domain-containing protein [Streptomyces sp. NBC_01294]
MSTESSFGLRLKALRQQQGLSQAALAGDEISTGYLSRLESGARKPTERVIAYLAKRLDVDRSAFYIQPSSSSLTQALSLAASTDSSEAIEDLIDVFATARDEDPLLRWQALWLIERYWHARREHAEELACLEELTAIADDLELPALQCRSKSRLARCLRAKGDVARALEFAVSAHQVAKQAGLPVSDEANALLALVSVEAEAGRLPDARAHAEELVELVAEGSETLRSEALWTAATVCSRQGDDDAACAFLHQAMAILDSRVDPVLWARLRLAAASLHLQGSPPSTESARAHLNEAEAAFALVGTPVQQQEILALQAHLAFEEGRYADARAAHSQLDVDKLMLNYRDRIRLQTLDSRLLIVEGHRKEGLARLKHLGEDARRAANLDLAAEIWQILAETLEHTSAG